MDLKEYTIKYYSNSKCWIAKYKNEQGVWTNKAVPRTIDSKDELSARKYISSFLAGETYVPGKKAKRTVRDLSDMWIQLRSNDAKTKPNTLRGFKICLENHILNHAIADLDIETELLVSPVRSWAMALPVGYSSRISYIGCLKSLISDSINEGWLNEDLVNVVAKDPIRAILKEYAKQRDTDSVVTYFNLDTCIRLLNIPCPEIKDIRRLKYLLALTTGLRHGEIQALTFGDIQSKDGVEYLNVSKQLYKSGMSPILKYNELIQTGTHKTELHKTSNAVGNNPKKESNRIVPIHKLLSVALKDWRACGWKEYTGKNPTDDSPIFGRSNWALNDGSLKPGDFCDCKDDSELLKKDLDRLGLPLTFENTGVEFTFHSLRHTFSTLLDSNKVEIEKIGHLLGHKAKSVTMRNYIGKNLDTFAYYINDLNFTRLAFFSYTIFVK